MAYMDRIEILLKDLQSLKQTPYKKFNMASFVRSIGDGRYWRQKDGPNVRQLRDNGENCGTAACLAGWVFINHAPRTHRYLNHQGSVDAWARNWLGMTPYEATHMFYGHWHPFHSASSFITKTEAVRYLKKALAAGNVLVNLTYDEMTPGNQRRFDEKNYF